MATHSPTLEYVMKAQAAAKERYENTGKMDVEKYSRSVIDNYQHRADLTDPKIAKASTVYAAAENVETTNGINGGRAARVAGAAIDGFEAKVAKGMEPAKARDETAREMAKRFDARGYDLERKVRQQGAEISF